MNPANRALRRALFLLGAIAVALGASLACGRSSVGTSAAPSTPEIRLTIPASSPAAAFVEVVGVSADDLAALRKPIPTDDAWTALLGVFVQSSDSAPSAQTPIRDDRPPMSGTYSVQSDAIRFTPRFSFDPGRPYEVVFDSSRLPSARNAHEPPARHFAVVSIPKRDVAPSTEVVQVYPSTDEVPENLLRLYVHFNAPMSRRSGLDYIHLLGEDGREINGAFLPLDTDFWNDDHTRYTVFFDPGRVKQDLLPRRQMGPSLRAGRRYTLVVDAAWPDAHGLPLAKTFRREFRVTKPELAAIDPRTWSIAPPAAGTREPLVVTFPQPLDHGLLLRALGVATRSGEFLEGDIRIEAGETRWAFVPASRWAAGEYQVVALSILESRAGNRIGRAFEADGRADAERVPAPERTSIPFRVR